MIQQPGNPRDEAILQPSDALLKDCRIERFRGSGRGGQKRNVTDSAVRVTHRPTGVAAESDATRSQIHNRERALRHLRKRIALTRRTETAPHTPSPKPPESKKSPEYCLWVAHLLDLMASADWSVGDAARTMGQSTGRLVKLLAADSDLWQTVNEARTAAGLRPLRMPR